MHNYTKFLTKKWRQKGAIIAFTALLLPMLIVGTGLAVDLGHVYVHYSRLQNAADAAALAGAHEYAVQGEKENNHPKADRMAEQYVQGNYHNLDSSEHIVNNIGKDRYLVGSKDGKTYYRVKLIKEVPLYFLGGIYRKFANKDTFTVPVISVAAIPNGTNKGWFNNNVIIYRTNFVDENSVENGDVFSNHNPANDIIRDTYDAHVAYTNGNGKYDALFRPKKEEPCLHAPADVKNKFFTSEAKKNYKENKDTVKITEKSAKVQFKTDNTMGEGCWFNADYEVYNFDTFKEYMDGKTKNATKITDQNYSATKDKLNAIDFLRVSSKDVPNFEFTVTESLGDSSRPLYLYVEEGVGLIKIRLNADTGRPLIICIGGSNNKRSQVEFYLDGHTYKGVLYAPYCDENRGILVKSEGRDSNFIGTIVGESMDIQNGNIHFSYQDFIGDRADGASGNTGTDGITLVNPPNDIIWS